MSNEVDWRRTWKPDLRSLPWQQLEIDGEQYLIKCKFSSDSYEFLLSDLTNFWHEDISEAQLKKRIQKLNPSIEASNTRILDQIKCCIQGSTERETTFDVRYKGEEDSKDEKLMLRIDSQLAGMPFAWIFISERAPKEMVSENLLIPLLSMVGELHRRQRELMKIIEAKDKEIDDYKSQGIKTSRKHIETQEFVCTAFENEMLTSKDFVTEVKKLGKSGFSEDCQDLYRQIMTKHAWLKSPALKAEATNDKSAEDLLDSESLQDRRKSSSGPSWGSNRLPPSINASKSPEKSPKKGSSSNESSPVKDSELLRRQALERRLEEEERKKQEPKKKKKKIAF